MGQSDSVRLVTGHRDRAGVLRCGQIHGEDAMDASEKADAPLARFAETAAHAGRTKGRSPQLSALPWEATAMPNRGTSSFDGWAAW